MSNRTSSTYERSSASAERVHHRTNVWHQLAMFAGLFLSPLLGLFAAWLIHVWVAGVHVHKGPINWDLNTPRGMPVVAAVLFTGITIYVANRAYMFTEHRAPALRNTLATTVGVVGGMFAIGVGVGPSYIWSFLFVVASWVFSVVWSIARTDVARNDKRTDEKSDLPKWVEALKGWRARKVEHKTDEHGEPLATEIEFEHADGDTVETLQDQVGSFESASGSPRGLSNAVGGDRADRSTITVMHQDPLKRPIELPDLEHVGGSIMQPLLIGKYADGSPVLACLAGGDGFSPTGILEMGMNRTGKTQTAEHVMLTDVISRRDAVILYMNKAKGVQDTGPIIPGIEVALIEDEEGSSALYRQAIKKVQRIIAYRQARLGAFGIHEWNAEQCWDNPPWRTENGKRVQMERMPALIVHVGEADAILSDAPTDATFIVSKGLSVGVITAWSLQRADATKMPTGLRFNLGTSICFGLGDEDSTTMALKSWVVKAGAHPDQWGQTKPGYFYFEGLGIDEKKFPMMARGFHVTKSGRKLRDELLARNLENAPRMAKLDRGSADATGEPGKVSWWDEMAQQTETLRRKLLTGAGPQMDPQPVPDDPQVADAVADDEEEQVRREVAEEVRETTHVEGVELYPRDENGDRATFADATKEFPEIPADMDLTWDDPKPAPRDREAALAAFWKACAELLTDVSLRDPSDPSGNTVIVTVGLVADRYRFRSRPFFSETLNAAASGRIESSDGITLAAADDLGPAGKYRIMRPHTGHAE